MNWFSLFKVATSTFNVLRNIEQSGVFKTRRFSSFVASGAIGFYEYDDGEVYEVRIEGLKNGPQHSTSTAPPQRGNQSRLILGRLKSLPIFQQAKESTMFGGDNAFVATFSDREQYKISVQHWSSSPFKNYFIDTKKNDPNKQPTSLGKQAQTEDPKAAILERAKRFGNEVSSDGFLIVYHGTRFYQQIKKQGSFRVGTYFGDNFNDAAHHGFKPWETGKMYVMKVKVLPEEVTPGHFLSARVPIPVREVSSPTVVPLSNYKDVRGM